MATSLKNRHETLRLNVLKEHIATIDRQVLLEIRTSNLILEAMDENDFKKVSALIDKLRKIKSTMMPNLKTAIELAETDLNEFTAGGPIAKAWSKLKSKFGIDNPIVKITTFTNALERGFSLIPQILKNNGIDLADVEASDNLETIIAQQVASNKENNNVEKKLNSIIDQIRKALSPSGIFGAFKIVPYIDKEALVNDLMSVPVGVFSRIAHQISTGPQTDELANKIKQNIGGAGGQVGSKSHGSTSAADPTQQTTGPQTTEPTKSGGIPPAGTGHVNPEGPGEKAGGGTQNKKWTRADLERIESTMKMLSQQLQKNPNASRNIGKILVQSGLDLDKLDINLKTMKRN